MQNQRRLVADCKHRSLGKAVSVPFPAVTAPHIEERNASFAYPEEVIWWRPSHNSLLWESTCEAGLCFTPLLWEAALQLQSTLRSQHPIIQLHIQHACSYVESNFVSQMNFFFFNETEVDKHGYQRGKWGWVRDKSGAWHKHLHPTIHKRDNQQGPTVWHRELYSIFCDKLDEKSIWKRMSIRMTESLSCTPETNTTL